MKKTISFIVPVYFEEDNVDVLHDAVEAVMKPLADRYDHEYVFTDNHSEDATWEKLRALCARDPKVRAYRFSRNFGYQRSIMTGYQKSRGDAVIQLDCDMQDPPELIAKFLDLWDQGNKVVYGVRESRKEGFLINWARKLFYRLIDKLSEDELPHDAGDFRLVDRQIVDELLRIKDSRPYIRGTLAGMGFTQIGVPYDREERRAGFSKIRLPQLISIASDAVLNHSVVPLRIATYLGLLIAVCTFLGTAIFVGVRVLQGQDWPRGFATLAVLILLGMSLNAIFFGVIGEYIGRIFQQMKDRPLTIIEESIEPKSDA